MVWVKIDDGFPEHRKALTAGDDACWLFVAALCYSARNLTDGHIPAAQIERLTGQRSAVKLADKLVSAGLFDKVDDGYQIHDYGDYQPTKERVEQQRSGTAERVRKHRRNSRSNGVTEGEVTPPTRAPAGARPSGSGSGPGEEPSSEDAAIARGQADGTLHPHFAEIIQILEAADGPHGKLLVEPMAVSSMLRAHPDADAVSAAHEVASMVAQGTNRVNHANSVIGAVLRRQTAGDNVRQLPQRPEAPRLANSRDLSRFKGL